MRALTTWFGMSGAIDARHERRMTMCPACGATMVTPEQAAVITGVTLRIVGSRATWFTSLRQKMGLLLVCVNSLSQKVPEPKCEVEYGPLTEAINLQMFEDTL